MNTSTTYSATLCLPFFRNQLVLVDTLYGEYWHLELGTFRFLPSNQRERRWFPETFGWGDLYRWGPFIATSQEAIMMMIMVLHLTRQPLNSPNNEGRTDIWEETFDILTLSNDSPTQMDTGEGPAPIWSEEYVSGWDGEADDSWGQQEWDNEAWGIQQEFGHVEPTEW
ncbi:hypothetical protein CTheo_9159 [Ceratobasidium theobromae]|uniref:Uncharacterized protein n=1 Tax=Ceratobasidium theobromae TaxID=1582974 RepID=A0A5N5Q7E1_9AGAM|nr:hypothetical protein CTheo_9159 [Ceratobasidium theobromae]